MTSDLQMLIPKLPVAITTLGGVAVSTVAEIRFSNTITIGSVIVAAIIVIAAGVFTLRNNLKSFWKELAAERGEQVKVLERKLAEATEELVSAQLNHTKQQADFAEEQREIRHQLKNELTTLHGQLAVEQAKHDLSAVIARLDVIEEQLIGADRFEALTGVIAAQSQTLVEIRDQLANLPKGS